MRSVKEILIDNNFSFSKKFGQNFITDKNFLLSVVDCAGITREDEVLEIGAGAGTLTKVLSEKAKKVVSFEIDENLKGVLKENLQGYDNIKLVFADALKTPIFEIEKHLCNKYKLVANLPYYITTPLIFKFLEETDKIESLTIMVQKEVGERITAQNSSKDYGALTIAIDFYGNAKIVKKVSRNMFYPVPNVDSVIVKIDIVKNKYDVDKFKFMEVVKAGFAMRRKTLINNLSQGLQLDKKQISDILTRLNLKLDIRAENLTTEQFVMLTKELFKQK